MQRFQTVQCVLLLAGMATAYPAASAVHFDARSARSGRWSDVSTWVNARPPKAGDNVQVRTGHAVTYDANSDEAVRVLHVAGTLTFAREKSTRLNVGLPTQKMKGHLLVHGVSQDNGDIASVTVNGHLAKITSSHAGVADWEISLALDKMSKKRLVAQAMDRARNAEQTGHTVETFSLLK